MSSKNQKLVALIVTLFILAIGIGIWSYQRMQPHQVGKTVQIPIGAFPKAQWLQTHKALEQQQVNASK